MIMVKMHLQKVDKSRYEESLNFRPKSAGKSVKSSKPDSMLLDLKNTELQEEKAKNAELKKHNELLKKRVYSKTEFETQYKTAKAESQEFAEKLKVSEKIRKQQNTLIKQLQSQISKLRNEKRPATASKIPKPKKITLENDENTDANLPANQDGLIMAPKYTAIGNVEVKQRSSGKLIDKKSKPKKKVKTKKEAKPIKKYMR
jgi:small-conductance mechanosensitive channel